jgi:hypothetical protein
MGVIGYLGHLSYEVFHDSLLFPIAISIVGVLIIFGGVRHQKSSAAWEAWLHRVLPESLLKLLPKDV